MKKNVLLINPWITDFTAYDFWLRPLGLLYAASILRDNADVDLRLIDCLDRFHPGLPPPARSKPDGRGHYIKLEIPKPEVLKAVPRRYSRYGIPIDLFLAELARGPVPDLVLMTCTMTYWYPGVQLAVELIRKKFGTVPVLLGGIYATLAEDHARRFSGADLVLPGPAEKKMLSAVGEIWGNGAVRDADSPSFRSLPRPALDLLGNKSFLPLLTSRGCPFTCSFCAGPLLYDRFEQREPADVIDEIADAHARYGTRDFAFYDDALLLKHGSHIVPILEGVIDRRIPVSFHTPNGLHVREIDRDLARLFARAGVRSIYLSQESTDPDVIREACPKVGRDDLETAIGHLYRAGYKCDDIHVYLIAGLPNQDIAGIKKSIRDVRRLGAKPRMAYFSPIPGTRAWRDLIEQGRMKADTNPLIFNKMVFPYFWSDISPEDYGELQALLNE
jgi:radical SAM superfamily enzyme YgiQ (UPF0313 family)